MDRPIIMAFIEEVDESLMTRVTREIFRSAARVKIFEQDGEYRVEPGWDEICQSIIQLMELWIMRSYLP